MMFSSNFSENDITSFPSKSVQDPNFFSSFPNFLSYEAPHLQSFSLMAGAARASSLKKDRHSKINTARGPRDRRMRLSLDVARRFFDLQDALGFDKASRTVDWLLRSSSSAIGELERAMGVVNSESCISEDYCYDAISSSATTGKPSVAAAVVRKREKLRRASVARESRREARERARERTSQKRRLMRENASITTAIASQEAHHFPIYDATNLPLSSDHTTTHELAALSTWNSFNFFHDNAAFLQQDEQIAEFQFNGKPWETYSFLCGSAASF